MDKIQFENRQEIRAIITALDLYITCDEKFSEREKKQAGMTQYKKETVQRLIDILDYMHMTW